MRKFVKDIVAGFEDAIAYLDGDKSRGVLTKFTVPAIDVKAIRKKTGLTQEAFSHLFAIKTRTLQDWEQARRTPGVSARVFLSLIDQHPATVKKTLKTLGHSLIAESYKKVTKTKPKTAGKLERKLKV